MNVPLQNFAVLGGGMLGMTLAHRLAQAGRRVTLFESAPTLGGLASAWTLGDVVWDRHYHVTLLSDAHLRGLLVELGLDDSMQWGQTRTGFYTGGRLHSMSNTIEFLRFPPLSLIDKLRLGATIFCASRVKDPRPLERVGVAQWLTRLSGRNVFETMWLPLLRAKLGENYRLASAAFIWATIARMYAARRSGLKTEMFGWLPGGYGRLLDRFARTLADEGVEIQTGCAARRVEPVAGGQVEVQFADRGPMRFDRAVLTVPAGAAAELCPDLSDGEKALLRGIRYQGIVCASLLLRRPLADFYVTNLTDAWVPFTAVIEMSALVDREQFAGKSLVYLPKYVAPDDPLFERSDAEIERSFVAALRRMYPDFRPEDVLAFRVSRVRRVFAIPTLGYSRRLAPMRTSVPGVWAVNSAHIVNGTLNVNETVNLANAAAAMLLRDPGPGGRESPAPISSRRQRQPAEVEPRRHHAPGGNLPRVEGESARPLTAPAPLSRA